MSFIIRLSVVLCCLFATSLQGYDWKGWFVDDKELGASSFWEPAHTSTYAGEFEPAAKLQINIAGSDNIMRLADSQAKFPELTIHHIYRYTPDDFAVYRDKVPGYANEQLMLGHWINNLAKGRLRDAEFIFDVDRFYRRLDSVAKGEPWLEQLQQELLSIRLELDIEVLKRYPDFESFIKTNHLTSHLTYHHHKITVDDEGTPELLVEDKMVPWTEFKQRLKVNAHGDVTNYFYTYQGFVPGQAKTTLRPFKKIDPATYDHQHILEIVSANVFPPHNWLRLIDSEGNLYSIGYWSKIPLKDLWGVLQNIFPSESYVLSPDLMEVAIDPNKFVVTPIHITQEQFDTLLSYLRQYQQNPKRYEVLGVLGGENCATFVAQAAQQIDIKIISSSWKRPFHNPYDVIDWQEMVAKWRRDSLREKQEPTEQQKLDIKYGLPL